MDIIFKSERLKREMESLKVLKQKYGDSLAKKIIRRMGEIEKSDSIGDLERNVRASDPHFLKGDRKEDLSIAVKKGLRIIVRPDLDEAIYISNGNVNFYKITKIKVYKLEDYHG